MDITVVIVVVIAALLLTRFILDQKPGLKTAGSQIVGGVTAVGRLAEAEAKLVAGRAQVAAKKEAALALHKAIDEVHAIIG